MIIQSKDILKHKSFSLLNEKINDCEIGAFDIDTRKISEGQATLFWCFKGKSVNGHDYIQNAYEQGVRNFVVTEKVAIENYPKTNFFIVDDILAALQELSKAHRDQFNIPIIGITGSNGKTTVKEWLYTMLTQDKETCKNPRSYNSQIGVPLAISRLKKQHQIGVFEAGPGEVGDMKVLSNLIDCNIGIFTNIGDAHHEGYPSIQVKAQEKALLFKNADKIIYCSKYDEIEKALSNYETDRKISWGEKETDQIRIIKTKILPDLNLQINLSYLGKNLTFISPLKSLISLENIMHCITLFLHLGYNEETINKRLGLLKSLSMRLELKAGRNNCTIINDSYSMDLLSFRMAIQFLEQQNILPRKTIVLTGFNQTKDDQALYKKVAREIDKIDFFRVILIGDEIQSIVPHLKDTKTIQSFKSTDDFMENIEDLLFSNETILLKGAQAFELDRFIPPFVQNSHNTILEINLYALAKNLKLYSDRLKPTTKMMVMVKASAYGSGGSEVAKMLEYNKVDYLAVVYAEEAIKLRKSGIKLPIMVVNPEVPQFENYVKYNIEPSIGNPLLLKKLVDFTERTKDKISIHIKIDTGMKRLGFDDDSFDYLLETLAQNPQLEIKSIFSHLVGSGEPEFDDFSKVQSNLFVEKASIVDKVIGYKPLRHILNSSGIVRLPQYHYDMVRLGAGLYGIDSYMPFRDIINTVLTLKTHVSQIKTVPKGETIGYSRCHKALEEMRTATLSIGYADGIPRVATNGNFHVMINNQLAPAIGNICMDMCMVDITNLEGINEGDEVIVFGESNPVENLAKAAGTIPYEIFTGISTRVKRVYFQ